MEVIAFVAPVLIALFFLGLTLYSATKSKAWALGWRPWRRNYD